MVAMPPASTAATKSAVREWKIRAAPESQPLRVGQIVHGGRSRRRDVNDPRRGQSMLKAQACAALLRGSLVPAIALFSRCVRHGVRLVEEDHAVEFTSKPVEQLLKARGLAFAFGGPQRRVSREQDALIKPDRCSLTEARLRNDQKLLLAESGPVALRV